MNLPRLEVHFEQTDIIYLYCYLLTEIKHQLEEEVSNEIESLAERYRDKYLHSDSSLFNKDIYQITLELIIDSFENIDSKTVYKDNDYWDFYEAIEKFLYSDFNKHEDGEIWGINNFCHVWESACLSYLLNNVDNSRFIFIDDTYLNSEKLSKKENRIFVINEKKLKPDAVFFNISNFIGILKQKINSYRLFPSNHDDYAFKTTFNVCHERGKSIQIGYQGQYACYDTSWYNNKHQESKTYDAIVENISSFRTSNQDNESIITSNGKNFIEINLVPNNFFSYWNISDNKTLDVDEFMMMKDLRHIFYIALFEQSITEATDFINDFIYTKEDVLRLSLLRDQYHSHNYVRKLYQNFLELSIQYLPIDLLSSVIQELDIVKINIIDFKYLSSEYIHNKDNIEKIKSRSIRKQFVYEYLLKEYLEKQKQIKQPKISSCFWIPEYNSGKEVVVSNDEYLDGYIDLALVDPIRLLQHYVQS